ncbi:MAG: hypothetical protein KJT03_03815, partial [Verrucomicrobiae bacterium]|nr:hypothetical protein [Verrucomicrobiae bacterium]
SEPRYFVVLCAYDFPALQAGEIKLQWRTRYSIRSVGQSFAEGIADMNRIASDFMGDNLKGFTQKRVDDSAYVSFGELEVIDIEEVKETDRETDFVIRDPSPFPAELQKPQVE